MQSNRRDNWPLIAILVAIFLYAVWLVFNQPIHIDEAITYRHFVSQGWKISVSTYPFPNNHVYFSLLSSFAVKWAGNPFIAMRMVSLTSAAISGLLIYRILRLDVSKTWSLIGVLFWSVSMASVQYASQARGYGLQTMFFLVALHQAMKIIRHLGEKGERPAWIDWFILSASVSLGLFTLPSFVIPASGLAIMLLLGLISEKKPLPWVMILISALLTVCLTVMLYLPLLHYAGLDSIIGNQWINERKWDNLPDGSVLSFSTDLMALLGLPFVLAIMVVVAHRTRLLTWKQWSLHLFLGIALLYMLAFRSIPFPRTFNYLTAIAAIALVWNISSFRTWSQSSVWVVSVAVVLITATTSFVKLFPKEDNPSQTALELSEEEAVKSMNIIYTDGWNDVGAMLDFYCWYNRRGPTVTPIYGNEFWREFNRIQGRYFLGETNPSESCVPLVVKGTVEVCDCR